LDTTTASSETTGSVFDATGNFYVTDFQANMLTKFGPSGVLIGPFGSGYNLHPESIIIDSAGNFYVGQADGTRAILKFNPSGTLLASFSPTSGPRGTDWTELGSDQCTLYYTSEGATVGRFNACTNTQLANFNVAPLPGTNAYAHRLLPTGGMLVADTSAIIRLDAAGNQIKTYNLPGITLLFALNLDPDGTSFWTADYHTGAVFKVDIATGNILKQWSAGGAPGFVTLGVYR
jgi:DNA-binding beta-propeller fold protein YncE